MARLHFVRLSTGGEGDPPIKAINRDRPIRLMDGNLVILVDHHPDGLKHIFFDERERLGFGEGCSFGS